MSELNKWNPFKFNRQTSTEKQEQPVAKRSEYVDPFDIFGRDVQHLMRAIVGNDDWFTPVAKVSRNNSWFGNFSPTTFRPSIDVTDNGTHVVVTAELAGMEKKDVELHVHENVLHIKGTKTTENSNEENGCYRTERFFGTFQRNIPLPQDVDANAAEAAFTNGLLTVKLPKLPEHKAEPRRIEF